MTAIIPFERFRDVLAVNAGEEYRALKYNPDLNCIFMQKGMSVLVLPAFEQGDGSVFIDKKLGFEALRQVLGPDRMRMIKEAFTS